MRKLKTNTVKYRWKALAIRKIIPLGERPSFTTVIVEADSYEAAKLAASGMLPDDYRVVKIDPLAPADDLKK